MKTTETTAVEAIEAVKATTAIPTVKKAVKSTKPAKKAAKKIAAVKPAKKAAKKVAAVKQTVTERASSTFKLTAKKFDAESFGAGQRAAIAYSLIQTCRLNDVDPQAWLADVLARIAEYPIGKLSDLLPWNWQPRQA